MGKHTTLSHEKRLKYGLDLCKKAYLDEHPEMEGVHLSENKMLFEKIRFYLQGTKYYKEFLENYQNERL